MTEFQELVKDAPNFASMERGELVAYAYAMYATGQKMEADNTKLRERIDAAHMSRLLTENENESLRELVRLMWKPFCWAQSGYEVCLTDEQDAEIRGKVCELGVEVDA